MGVLAAASGSALTEKRGAAGMPFFTCSFMAAGEAIHEIASKARWARSGGSEAGTASRKPPMGDTLEPPGPAGWGR